MLSAEELGRLGAALRDYEAAGGSIYAVAAIRLLVFTGARLVAARHDCRTRRRAPRRFIYRRQRSPSWPLCGAKADNPHVIAGWRHGSAFVNLHKPWKAIRAAAGLDGLRIHDLRHAFASVAASSGLSLYVIGRMFGHTQASMTQRYAHLASDPVAAAAAATEERIADALAQPEESAAEVAPLGRRVLSQEREFSTVEDKSGKRNPTLRNEHANRPLIVFFKDRAPKPVPSETACIRHRRVIS